MKKEFLAIFVVIFLFLIAIVTASTVIDNSQGDFDSGTYNWTFYNSSGFVQLNESRLNGTFTSQIFNSGGTSQWNNISWFTEIPYNQELPNNQEVETGDFLRGINMTGNVLLLHLNNDSAYGENDTYVYDFSGNGNNGTLIDGEGDEVTSDGKLNGAFDFDGGDDYVDVGSDSSLQIGTNDFTISLWIDASDTQSGTKSSPLSNFGGNNYWYVRYNGYGTKPFLRTAFNNNLVDTECDADIGDAGWYHLTWVIDRDGNQVCYVNSHLSSDVEDISTYSAIDVTGSTHAHISYLYGVSGFEFNGSLDEVAIWNRTLSAQEIEDIYKRGIFRLNLSVQSCNDAICEGETFTNLGNDLTSPQILSVTDKQYFQYKFEFETDNYSYTHKLYNISLNYDQPPNITLFSPEDEDSLEGAEQTFTCNATANAGNLVNISLYHNATGTWHLNATNNVTGSFNETSFTVSGLPYTTFVWNCLATDSNGMTSFADSNFTLTTITDATKPAINSYEITSSLTSGETATIRANITDSSEISLIWFTINNTDGILINYTMSQEGSTDFYNTTFETGKAGTWYYKVYANDSYSNINDTMEWQSFSISAPSATPENEVYPTYALPSSSITITADLSATDLLKVVNATLNVPSGFEFPFSNYNQTQEIGNLSALQTQTARWFVYLPNDETTHTFNVTWTDKYNNSFQGDNKQIIVTYDTANLTGRVETLENLVSTLQSNVSTLFTNLGNLQSDFTSLNDTVNSINATVTNNTQDIANLQGNVSAVQTDIANLNNSINSINTTVNQNSQNISDLYGNVTQINLDITNINTNLTYVWSNITDLYNKVNNNIVNITDIKGDITTINSQISSINSNINSLNNTINAFAENSTFPNVIAFPELEAGDVLESEIQVRDINGNFVNASSVKISLYDPNDNLVVDNVNYISQLGTGRYFYNYTTPSTPTGQWLIYVNVTRQGNSFIDREYFRLTGGPFDIRNIEVTDSTAPTLGILVILENMGDGVTDIVIDWNLTRTDTGALLDSGQDTIGVTNEVTHTITPETTYTGEAQITFLGTWSSTEKAGAQETFTITSAPSSDDEDTGGGGSGGGGGSITGKAIYETKDEDIQQGKTQSLKDGEKIKFNIIQESVVYEHSLEVIDLQTNKATITVYSKPLTIMLYVGENKTLDLNEDGFYDLYIKLDKIENNKAYIYLKSIYEEVEEEPELSVEIEQDKTEEELPSKTKTFLSNIFNKIGQFFKPTFSYIKQNNLYFIIGFGILVFILLLIIIIVKISKRKKKSKIVSGLETKLKHLKELKHKKKISEKSYHTEKEELLQKINKVLKNKHFLLIIGIFGLMSLFTIFLKPAGITGGVIGVGEQTSINWWGVFAVVVILLLIGIFGILLYILKEIREIKAKINRKERLLENSTEEQREDNENKYLKEGATNNSNYKTKNISELINKKVYTNSGYYLGKIKEIILGKNRIDSLKIKLDKKQKFKIKGVIVKYKEVKSFGHVVIVDSRVLEKIDSLRD